MLPHSVRQFGRYLRAVGRHYGAIVAGGLGWAAQQAYSLGGSRKWLGARPLPEWLKPGALLLGLFVAQYLAWRDAMNQVSPEPALARGFTVRSQLPVAPTFSGKPHGLRFEIACAKPLNGKQLRIGFDNPVYLAQTYGSLIPHPYFADHRCGRSQRETNAIIFHCPDPAEKCCGLEGEVDAAAPIRIVRIEVLSSRRLRWPPWRRGTIDEEPMIPDWQ